MPGARSCLGRIERTPAARPGGCSRPLRARPARGRRLSPFAVVTGGSGGIGAAVVSELRSRGWEVISLSRREGCDVSDEAQVKAAFSRLETLDAMVHCAAVLVKKPIAAMTLGDWDTQMLRIAGVERPRLEPAEVARVIAWLAGRDSKPVSGGNIRVDP